jgi:hypothetical protein
MAKKYIIAFFFILISFFSLNAMIKEVFINNEKNNQNEGKIEKVTFLKENKTDNMFDDFSEQKKDEKSTTVGAKEKITSKFNVVHIVPEIDSGISENIKEPFNKVETINFSEKTSEVLDKIKDVSLEKAEEAKENITENITIFVEKNIVVPSDKIVEKVSEAVTKSIREGFVLLVKPLISSFLSLLSPEEILEILNEEIEIIDICKE